jgi:diaminohydroxyphosphoribosylaminopyrimidine deaminase/5-amino-6-(5-phosphoribosylamino)uracil reductase
VPVLIATALPDDPPQAKTLREHGVDIVSVPDKQGRVDLNALMNELGARGVDSVLVEGGGALHASLFSAGLVDEAIVYLAPKVVGGADAKTPVEGIGIEIMANAFSFGAPTIEQLGNDLKLTYRRI